MYQNLPYRSIWWGHIFSAEGPSSQTTLEYVKLTKKLASKLLKLNYNLETVL